jgi:hypothetical protein
MGLGSGIRFPGSDIRDTGSGKKTYPGSGSRVKKAPDPGSGSATLEENLEILAHKKVYNQKWVEKWSVPTFVTVCKRF